MALAAVIGWTHAAQAQQSPPPPPRADYVFLVYVDPLHGDDAWATVANPGLCGPPTPVQPLSFHPDVTIPRKADGPIAVGGLVNHAPYPFKTVTAALAWAQPTGGGCSALLGHAVSHGGAIKTVRWIIIHCLPGLYGPLVQGLSRFDSRSGLPYNGEQFPIVLPWGFSIQGASALDTIFDARGQGTNVIHMGGASTDAQRRSFIDSVSIRGAACDASKGLFNSGAGIRIGADGMASAIVNNTLENFARGQDNQLAYYNPPPLYPNHPPQTFATTFASNVVVGIIHPPGTTMAPGQPAGSLPNILVPAGLAPRLQVGPWSPCPGTGQQGSQFQVGTWGFGDVTPGCPDLVPCYDGLGQRGIRVNAQRSPDDASRSNLQTFLMICEVIPTQGQQVSSPPPRIGPTPEALLRLRREMHTWTGGRR